jgi:O-antigen/teichoic acid export membrane protein
VSMMFFPHVAGAPRAESDNQVAMVSRVTLLVSSGVALMLIPAAALLIAMFLPAFGPSFPPLLVLLPAVVMLSIANVIGGYVTGIGKPGILSWINVVAFVANIVANLVLIPALGIVGASAASLVSYSLSAVLLSAIAARFSHRSIADFWVIRWSDVVYLATTAAVLVRRLRGSSADA